MGNVEKAIPASPMAARVASSGLDAPPESQGRAEPALVARPPRPRVAVANRPRQAPAPVERAIGAGRPAPRERVGHIAEVVGLGGCRPDRRIADAEVVRVGRLLRIDSVLGGLHDLGLLITIVVIDWQLKSTVRLGSQS
jgi:hypothetical protein